MCESHTCVCLFMQVCVFLFAGHMYLSGRVCVHACSHYVDNDLMQTLPVSSTSRLQWQPNQSSLDPLYC